eukprot:scaffold29122_cov100-Skeletonema_dohrnii-CCMP3373.AAC.3
MVLECCLRPSHIGPHQVTYVAVTWLMYLQRALVVEYILSCYRNRLRHNYGPSCSLRLATFRYDTYLRILKYVWNRYPLSTYEGEQEDGDE